MTDCNGISNSATVSATGDTNAGNDSAGPVTITVYCPALAVSKSTLGTADEQTQAAWRVTDLEGEIAILRSRGVEIQEYDLPGLKTVDGIADIGFARMAWFIDPGKNCVGIMQLR